MAHHPTPEGAVVQVRPGRDLWVQRLEAAHNPSGSTVFLVHGGGGRSAQWRLVVPALLAAGHRVVAFDALGHGQSPAPRLWRAYRTEATARDLLALLQTHGSRHNLLVAHSYGALVVLNALVLQHRRALFNSTQAAPAQAAWPAVAGAVLLAPAPLAAPARPLWPTYLPVPWLERLRPRLSAAFRAAAWGPNADPALVDHETALSDTNPLYTFKALWRQRRSLNPLHLLPLNLPVQVLVGSQDRLTPPAVARSVAAALPQAQVLTLPDAGHQLMLEAPTAVCSAVLQALAATAHPGPHADPGAEPTAATTTATTADFPATEPAAMAL